MADNRVHELLRELDALWADETFQLRRDRFDIHDEKTMEIRALLTNIASDV